MGEVERLESWQRGKDVLKLLIGMVLMVLLAVAGAATINHYVPM